MDKWEIYLDKYYFIWKCIGKRSDARMSSRILARSNGSTEECISDAMPFVLKSIETWIERRPRCSVLAYITQGVRNWSQDVKRRCTQEYIMLQKYSKMGRETVTPDFDIDSLIDTLPPDKKEAYLLFREGLTRQEIATKMGRSVQWVSWIQTKLLESFNDLDRP